MKVYLLYVSNFESDWLSGIYNTREKAEDAAKSFGKQFHYWIEEDEVL